MARSSAIFSPSQARRPINQYLCVALMGAMCLWTVVYYLVKSSEIIGDVIPNVNAYSAVEESN